MTCPVYTLLIVEDFLPDRQRYQRDLVADSSCVYRFLEADSAIAALEICRTQMLDAILLKDGLPNATGLEFLKALKAQSAGEVPPVVIVANELVTDELVVDVGEETVLTRVAVQRAVEAIKLGAEDYLIKKFLTLEQLQSAMRNAIENARLKSQQRGDRFRVSIENMLDCFGIYSAIRDQAGAIVDFRVDYLNAAALESNRMTQDDLGKKLCEVLPAHRQTGLFDKYCRVVETGKPLIEEEMTYADVFGTGYLTRAYDIQASKLDDGFVASWRDVTDRQQANLNRQASEVEIQRLNRELDRRLEELQTILNAVPVGIAIADDAQCKVIRVNGFAQAMLTVPPDTNVSASGEQAQALPFRQLRNGQDIPPEELPMQQAAAQGEAVRDVEIQMVRSDGATFDWWVSAVPLFDEAGTVRGCVAAFTDVTDAKRRKLEQERSENRLRQQEEQLRLFVKHTPAGIAMFDREMRYILVSDRWLSSYGLENQDLIGRSHYEIFPEVPERWKAIHQRCLAGAVEACEEDPFPRADGSVDWVRWEIHPWRTSTGEIGGIIVFSEVITERRQAEIALQEQTKLLQLIMDSIGDGLILANPRGEFVLFNQAAEQIFGTLTNERSCEEWSSTYGLFLPDQQTFFPDEELPLARAIRGEAANDVEVFVQRDRALAGRWISISGYPVLDRGNGITGGVITCRDITERKHAESELQTQRQLLENIVNYLPSSVAIIRGRDLTFQLVNPAYQAIAPGKQMIGKPIGEVWTEMQPAFTKRCHHVLETGEPYYASDEEFEISRTDSGSLEVAYFSWSMHRLNLPGEDGAGILITVAETSDRKRAELLLSQTLQKLNFHIENSPLAVIEWDHDFRVSRWSSAAERAFGWRGEEVIGKSFGDWKFVFDEDLEQVQSIGQRLAQGIEQRNVVYNRNYTKSGEVVYCEWYNSTLVDPSGRLISILSLALDVSDRVSLEQERDRSLKQEQAAREAAERANRLKDEFLAVLSHELRSPLNPILGWTKLLRGGKLNPVKTSEALATIERNAKLQSQLIEDLLDISRIMRGKLVLNPVPVNLPLVISGAIDTVRLAAETKSIKIATYLDPNIRKVSGDAGRLQQVVWNLLSNAVKFTPSGGQVEVHLTQTTAQVQLQVIDTGKGIVSEFLPHVFEHFRQEDGATTRKFGGLGLGLAIARQIVELHGGRIWVESVGENQGATFTVELPALQTVNSISSPEATVNKPILAPIETLPLANLRVLVVDDEPDSRAFVAFVVEQAGAEVIQADSALAALQTLASLSIDILLSDIGMPDMNGYTLMRQIRESSGERNQQIPAIALTAYAGEADQQQAIEAGFQHHLAKPVEATEIITIVARLCGRQGKNAE